ncbi:BON domain-containing protein [Roseateles asaccharophilus]|uniref:Osmotically-inducible protein OsmY n=1 Tax=Roseateles asaccharophilus TaxID=582607 RepID=A0ABU2A5T0_9BURK|nr:BON domain-containing protein [Roseateles asaccharophilus]MDR7331963.1 osmotically-inducible protein OsmY [Roseateles asaccharophilus]
MQQTTRLVRLLSAALMATAGSAAFAADPAPAQPAPQQVAQAQPADPAVAAQAAAVLQQDKDLQALPLTVSSTAAGVIVVKGAAPSADLAQKAIKLVAAVPGVKEVRNEIKVG